MNTDPCAGGEQLAMSDGALHLAAAPQKLLIINLFILKITPFVVLVMNFDKRTLEPSQ